MRCIARSLRLALSPFRLRQGGSGWSETALARALADRLDGQGIVAHSVHPGAVETNFFSNASPETQARLKHLPKATEAEGADTLIWLASAPEAAQSNGDYWHKRARREPNPTVYDKAVRDRFWAQSEALVEAALQKAAAH
jgi:short-subunit dehydrogenase